MSADLFCAGCNQYLDTVEQPLEPGMFFLCGDCDKTFMPRCRLCGRHVEARLIWPSQNPTQAELIEATTTLCPHCDGQAVNQ